ncbi:tryptophan synthase subunit alpha [Candidatus Bathyarchaeota archaeon]|nr:tryptophan synthase subunit alpha [Candidatus Bathyarchaeota archaeon]
MREIEKTFQNLRKRNEGALIAYVAGGDPRPEYTPDIVEALIDGGADIIELGIPFSDPIADGPTIQAATVRALKAGTTPKMVLEMVSEVKDRDKAPVAVLTYYNPLFRMGLENFFRSASRCGVDGVVVPDLPIEEAQDYKKVADAYEIDTIFLAAPSTSKERLQKIVAYTSGFLYLVSVFGVTGTRKEVQELTINLIRKALPSTTGRIPLAVGFGISKPEHVRTIMLNGADGVIVGSRFVKIIEKNREKNDEMIKEIKKCAHELKKAATRR